MTVRRAAALVQIGRAFWLDQEGAARSFATSDLTAALTAIAGTNGRLLGPPDVTFTACRSELLDPDEPEGVALEHLTTFDDPDWTFVLARAEATVGIEAVR